MLALALAGCGAAPERPTLAPPAKPRTIELDWNEPFRSAGFVFRVERLVIGDDGWRVTVSVENDSRSSYRIGRQSVGLVLLETETKKELQELTDGLERAPPSLRPDRVTPRAPALLRPGQVWKAEFESSVVLRTGSVVRVLFGPFTRIGARGRESADVLWVTDHAVRI